MAFENAYLETNFFYTGNNVSVGEIDEFRWYKNSLIFLRKSQRICRTTLYETLDDMCNGGKVTLTFVHQSARCTGSQGLPGLGYGPPVAAVWLPWAGKAIIGGLLPMAIARDVTSYTSYRTTSRWCVQCYVTVYIIYGQYKSSCNPVPRSPLFLW